MRIYINQMRKMALGGKQLAQEEVAKLGFEPRTL